MLNIEPSYESRKIRTPVTYNLDMSYYKCICFVLFFLASNLKIQLRPGSIAMGQFGMHSEGVVPQSTFCWFTLFSHSCNVANLQRPSLFS